MDNEDDSFFGTADAAMIFLLVLVLSVIVAIQAALYKEPVKETYKVTTVAGEIYEFKTQHHCAKHLKKAVQQVYKMQDKPLSKVALKALPNVAKDLARIYDGNVSKEKQCDIDKLTIKPIKQIKVKPKKEVKK